MLDQRIQRIQSEEIAIQHEIDEILEELGDSREENPDFVTCYTELRRQYGQPSDEAREYLLTGDFATFEELIRDGDAPLL